jgi:hypothetical protein
VAEAIAGKGVAAAAPVEVWFQDEMRVGQKNGLVYQRAKKGTRLMPTHAASPGCDQPSPSTKPAGTTRKLQLPSNISLVHLPPASPELNPDRVAVHAPKLSLK